MWSVRSRPYGNLVRRCIPDAQRLTRMGAFRLLFGVAIHHEFFSSGEGLPVRVVPTPSSARIFHQAHLLFRKTRNGFGVFFDEERLEALELLAAFPDEPLRLAFKLFSQDPYFANYTDPSPIREDAILYFHNQNQEPKKDKTRHYRLHGAEAVSDGDFLSLHAPELTAVLSKQDRFARPSMVVALTVGPTGRLWKNPKSYVGPQYVVKFKPKATFWTYYLNGDLSFKTPAIVDADRKTQFEYLGPVQLPNRRTALSFRSTRPLPFRDRYDVRFQLKDPGSGGKVLMKRLPVASAAQLNRALIQGEERVVSDIFVNG